MTSSLSVTSLLVGVSLAVAAALTGMVLIDISKMTQIRHLTGHEGENVYGVDVSSEANDGTVSVHSRTVLSRAERFHPSATLLWIGLGMMGLAWASGLCLLVSAFLDDVFRVVRRSE